MLFLMRSLRFVLHLKHCLGDIYHWKMMPFGIRSAPEVFQHKMHELIEGLRGVEVIADDSVVVGYGESWQSAIKAESSIVSLEM